MNPYITYVQSLVSARDEAESYIVQGNEEVRVAGQKVLLFSPHPDDECITGLLPLRLQREAGFQVINIPMTFGSNKGERERRLNELTQACSYLGWVNHDQESLESLAVNEVTLLLEEYQPTLILYPHKEDWNSRHEEVHRILEEALRSMPERFECVLVQTEYWRAMKSPNLLVEGDVSLVADLVAATSLHTGEVERNPYHLSLPAWMQDNVRRGAELIGEQGSVSPNYQFGTNYDVKKWKQGRVYDVFEKGRFLPLGASELNRLLVLMNESPRKSCDDEAGKKLNGE